MATQAQGAVDSFVQGYHEGKNTELQRYLDEQTAEALATLKSTVSTASSLPPPPTRTAGSAAASGRSESTISVADQGPAMVPNGR